MLPTVLAVAALTLLPCQDSRPVVSLRDRVTRVTGARLWAECLRLSGKEEREAQRYPESLAAYTASLLLDEDDMHGLGGRAKAFTALGRHNDAADDYARLIALDPNDPDSWNSVAEGWIARGKFDEAQQCFNRAVELSPEGCDRYYRRILQVCSWLGLDSSRTPFLAGFEKPFGLTPATIKNVSADRLERAEWTTLDALVNDTDNLAYRWAHLHAIRGVIRHALGRHKSATADYDDALVRMADQGALHYSRACLAHELHDELTASSHLTRAEEYGHERSDVVSLRAQLHWGAREWDQAAPCFAEWWKLDPENLPVIQKHAVCLRMLGKDDEADSITERAAELVHMRVARLLFDQAHTLGVELEALDVARRLLTRTLDRRELTPRERSKGFGGRGDILSYEGHSKEAFDDYTASVRLDPRNSIIRRTRAKLVLFLQRPHIAASDAEAYFRQKPWDLKGVELLQEARGQELFAASVAGRAPEFRPAGPVVPTPITVSIVRWWVEEYLSP